MFYGAENEWDDQDAVDAEGASRKKGVPGVCVHELAGGFTERVVVGCCYREGDIAQREGDDGRDA